MRQPLTSATFLPPQLALDNALLDQKTSSLAPAPVVAQTPPPTTEINLTPTTVNTSTTTTCTCTFHSPHTMLDVTLPTSTPDEVFRRVFEDETLVARVHGARGSVGMRFGTWKEGREKGSVRVLEYDVAFKAPFMPQSTTPCVERQEVLDCGDGRFTVSSIISTPSVPFGKSFSTVVRYCITSLEPTGTRLRVTMSVKFEESVWMKSHIESSAVTNTKSFFADLLAALNQPQPQPQPNQSLSASPRLSTPTSPIRIPPRSSSVPPSLRHLLPQQNASAPETNVQVDGLRRRASSAPVPVIQNTDGAQAEGGQYYVGSMLSQIPFVVAVVAGGLVMWVLQGLGY